jgi:2-polyprenyl-3-methyl-5-hydroxy-6-metoxy-1,4-benzoquinol methylase
MTKPTCRLCGGTNHDIVSGRLRHDVERNVLRCKACELVFLQDADADDTGSYYRGNYRAKHGPVIGRAVSPAEHYALVAPFQQGRLQTLACHLRPDMRLLEVGASSGSFLDAVEPHVSEAWGLELNAEDVDYMRQRGRTRIVDRPLADAGFDDGFFDVVMMFEVLEHIPEPDAMLREIRRILAPGGLVVAEVPNHDDALLKWYRNEAYRQFYYRVPHLYYFNATTLTRLAEQCGFQVEIAHSQQYGLFNHLHWHFSNAPMPSITVARGGFCPGDGVGELGRDLSDFFERTDRDYRNLLARHGATDMVTLIGRANGD